MSRKSIFFLVFLMLLLPIVTFAQKEAKKLQMAFSMISNLYVDATNDSTLVEDALIGMLEKLDPHSNYMNADEAKEMTEPLEGKFDGIGIQYNLLTDTIYVIQVIPGGPSEKVGLMAGDKIIMIDDSIVAGVKISTTSVTKKLRGEKGTQVRVHVMRKGAPELIEFKITRGKIPVFSIDAAFMVDKTIGYIKLNRFSATSADEFKEACKKLEKLGMKQLILDLQGNGGGYLHAATDLVDHFIDKNKMIVYTKGRKTGKKEYHAGGRGVFEKGRLVVIIDESSASASEILAGAVQDWDRAVVVGRRSFGKGLVQMPLFLPDGSMIRLTVSRYYTPSGRCIQKPYEKGRAYEYEKDLINRFNRGELLSADSIHFPDSLKYRTMTTDRVVYGGGGIMPDLFVPIDTTMYSNYHRSLLATGNINHAAMNFLDRNREELMLKYKRVNFDKFKKEFLIPEELMHELIALGEKDKVPFNQNEYKRSEFLIRLQLKALIARDLFDMTEYYKIINDVDPSYVKAIDVIRNEDQYAKLLKKNK